MSRHSTSRTARFGAKYRQHRDMRAFQRALRDASPAMQQELVAAAAHQHATEGYLQHIN